jgi:hypothetical protein
MTSVNKIPGRNTALDNAFPSVSMTPMSAAPDERALPLLLEEYFNAEDGRFIETLRKISSFKFLAGFADRWKKDPGPWARQQILDYLKLPLGCQGHQPIIKRLFKHAEENKDDELMAAFLVVFDCLVRRARQTKHKWDYEARTSYEEEKLVVPKNVLQAQSTTQKRGGRLFSYHTRYYLRRRAWRYFRRMSFQRRDAYVPAAVAALLRYEDADLTKGENILDSWGLVHICFGEHDALEFQASHIVLKDRRSLGEVAAAPEFPALWQTPAGADLLFSLVWLAPTRVVRVWAMQWLRKVRETVPMQLQPEKLLRLLDHDDAEVQHFGAELLDSASGLETMPVSFWLLLLKTKNLTALETMCEVVKKHVSGDRLDLAQCIEIACAEATPVARLGTNFLKSRKIDAPTDRALLSGLAKAKCPAIGTETAEWALGILGKPETYDLEKVQPFFDSQLASIRTGAWNWLLSAGSPGYNDPVLWSRLTETPYDDVRLRLVDQLEKREQIAGVNAAGLAPLWCSVLLGVHRGGRQKARAVRQIGTAIISQPADVEKLLPVLAVAVRSVRKPEARAGLAAVVSAVEARPELAEVVKRHLPELSLA